MSPAGDSVMNGPHHCQGAPAGLFSGQNGFDVVGFTGIAIRGCSGPRDPQSTQYLPTITQNPKCSAQRRRAFPCPGQARSSLTDGAPNNRAGRPGHSSGARAENPHSGKTAAAGAPDCPTDFDSGSYDRRCVRLKAADSGSNPDWSKFQRPARSIGVRVSPGCVSVAGAEKPWATGLDSRAAVLSRRLKVCPIPSAIHADPSTAWPYVGRRAEGVGLHSRDRRFDSGGVALRRRPHVLGKTQKGPLWCGRLIGKATPRGYCPAGITPVRIRATPSHKPGRAPKPIRCGVRSGDHFRVFMLPDSAVEPPTPLHRFVAPASMQDQSGRSARAAASPCR